MTKYIRLQSIIGYFAVYGSFGDAQFLGRLAFVATVANQGSSNGFLLHLFQRQNLHRVDAARCFTRGNITDIFHFDRFLLLKVVVRM